MSDYYAQDKEDLVQCPYNRTHMIRNKRMPFHLMKCRKEHQGLEFVTCPFNARHEMPKPELRYHISLCPDKKTLEMDIVHAQGKENDEGTLFKGDTNVPTYFPEWNQPTPSENWDEEIPRIVKIGVDPKFLDNPNRPIFKNTVGMTPAEKKAYKLKLQRRHARQQQGLPPEDSDEENEVAPLKPQQQLRIPRQAPQVLQQQGQLLGIQRPLGVSKPSVFEYSVSSLSKAGLGRGGLLAQTQAARSVGQMQNNAISFQGQGRGAVRQGQAVPLKHAYANGGPGQAQGLTNGYQAAAAENLRAVGTSIVDDHAMLLQAMSRGRGRGAGTFVPKVGNPPGFQTNNQAVSTTAQHVANGARADSFNVIHTPPAFVIPVVTNHVQSAKGTEIEDEGATSSMSEEDEAAKLKEIRKLQKKLNGIENLMKKQGDGEALSEEELVKIAKRNELEDKLTALRL